MGINTSSKRMIFAVTISDKRVLKTMNRLIHPNAWKKKNSRKFAVTSSPAPPQLYTNWDRVEPHLALYHTPNCYVYC